MQYKEIMDKEDMSLIIDRLARQIVENEPRMEDLIIVGIQRRGADIAKRLTEKIGRDFGEATLSGTLDINLYRDDWTSIESGIPVIGQTWIPCSLDGKKVLLVDDVLFSGRTIRAALEAILDYGRPQSVETLVLIDRGHRELPICANYAGRVLPTGKDQHVDVLLEERDGRDAVFLR